MKSDFENLLKNAPPPHEMCQIIEECDRLQQQGNLPDMKAKLGKNYKNIRWALETLTAASRFLEALKYKKHELAELDKHGARYKKLLLCESFYRTWRGTMAIGAPCGVPYAREKELFLIHKEIESMENKQKPPPNTVRNRSKHPTARITSCSFRERRSDFNSEKEAYVWMIEQFLSVAPDLFENPLFAAITASKKRRYFAREPEQLYPGTPQLAQNKNNYVKLSNDWLADTNMDAQGKLTRLSQLSVQANIEFGIDWTWQVDS